MVPVGGKAVTERKARAGCRVRLGAAVMEQLRPGDGELSGPKGPVFQTAIIAGTQAVKKTSELIPFCHPLPLEGIRFEIRPRDEESVSVECTVSVTGKTGVEMEALTGASVAALTIYDMVKALSPEVVIEELRLLEKRGGKRDFNAGSDQS